MFKSKHLLTKKEKEKMSKKSKQQFNLYATLEQGLDYANRVFVRLNTHTNFVIPVEAWQELGGIYGVTSTGELSGVNVTSAPFTGTEYLYQADLSKIDDILKFLRFNDTTPKEPSEKEFTVTIKNNDGGQVTTEQAAEAFRQLGSNVRKMEKYNQMLQETREMASQYNNGVPLSWLHTHLGHIEELGKEIGFNGSNDD